MEITFLYIRYCSVNLDISHKYNGLSNITSIEINIPLFRVLYQYIESGTFTSYKWTYCIFLKSRFKRINCIPFRMRHYINHFISMSRSTLQRQKDVVDVDDCWDTCQWVQSLWIVGRWSRPCRWQNDNSIRSIHSQVDPTGGSRTDSCRWFKFK